MSFKRKRKVKLEVTQTYEIHFFDNSKDEMLDDYDEIKASGVEEEEEKEIHLQNVLNEKALEIPIPLINSVDKIGLDYYKSIRLKKFINFQNDTPNIYIKTKHEKELLRSELKINTSPKENGQFSIGIVNPNEFILINEYKIEKTKEYDLELENLLNNEDNQEFNSRYLNFKKAIKFLGKDPKYLNNIKNINFINFILRRVLINYEKNGYEAYCCFKPRRQIPKIKSRKNENSTLDKLQYLSRELIEIEKLCKLDQLKIDKEIKVLKNNVNLIKNYGSFLSSSIKKKLFKKKSKCVQIGSSLFLNKKKFKTRTKENNILPDIITDISSKISTSESKIINNVSSLKAENLSSVNNLKELNSCDVLDHQLLKRLTEFYIGVKNKTKGTNQIKSIVTKKLSQDVVTDLSLTKEFESSGNIKIEGNSDNKRRLVVFEDGNLKFELI